VAPAGERRRAWAVSAAARQGTVISPTRRAAGALIARWRGTVGTSTLFTTTSGPRGIGARRDGVAWTSGREARKFHSDRVIGSSVRGQLA
jgi:hypothetical protein